MATSHGERPERPTAKRLKDARERGQVARSRDLSAAASLGVATLALGWGGFGIVTAVTRRLATGLSTLPDHVAGSAEPLTLAGILWTDLGLLATVTGPPALAAGLVSAAVSTAQTGWSYSPKALHLDWSRINPVTGFKRFAPQMAGLELLKALVGVAAVGALSYFFIRSAYGEAMSLVDMTPASAARRLWDHSWALLWRASLVLVVLAVGDYAIQRWRWLSQLKMTRQDVRDEAKLYDGSPEIKARVRRVQREMSRRRMIHAVKDATVVITNPTHLAVALEYRRDRMSAPRVVAKGQDELAARIRAAAREHGVPIVENVSLARALHAAADVGESVPAALFGAVAEVLAYLVRLKQLVL